MWHTRRMVRLIALAALIALAVGCGDDSTTDPPPRDVNDDIPADPDSVSIPDVSAETILPRVAVRASPDDPSRIRLNLFGMLAADRSPLTLEANRTLFVLEDGVAKGLWVSPETTVPVDVVFVVPRVPSVAGQAEAVTAQIDEWSDALIAVDVHTRFGSVGFTHQVVGAFDLDTPSNFGSYLSRPGAFGEDRFDGFAEGDDDLEAASEPYECAFSDSNPITGIRFAMESFAWRAGALRLFVLLTDDFVYPETLLEWSTRAVCDARGADVIVTTVWGGVSPPSLDGACDHPIPREIENPWCLSACTGAPIDHLRGEGAGLQLDELAVSHHLREAVAVEFLSADPDAIHELRIVVSDGDDDGELRLDRVDY